MNYGEAFNKMGISGMGHIGAPWCGFAPDGVMVMMAHKNFFHKEEGRYVYDDKGNLGEIEHSASARKSIELLVSYFQPNRPIRLLVGEFSDDGGVEANGKIRGASFLRSSGDFYEATMVSVERTSGAIKCACTSKSEV